MARVALAGNQKDILVVELLKNSITLMDLPMVKKAEVISTDRPEGFDDDGETCDKCGTIL